MQRGVRPPCGWSAAAFPVVLAYLYAAYLAADGLLQNHVKHETAPYKYPRVIEFVDVLPKTISGKIRRVEIRENDRESRG